MPPSVQRRVRGGKATSESLLWLASLIGSGWSCTGTLINSRYLLTAAHCVKNRSPDSINVTLGAVTETQRSSLTRVPVDKVILHPRYDGYIANDVALLRLKTEIPARRLRPVCLPTAREASGGKMLPKIPTFITGFGKTATASLNGAIGSKQLMRADVESVQESVCANFYRRFFTRSTICAGRVAGATVGDGGAPLMQKRPSDQRITQAGVTSYITPGTTWPDLYESTARHADWILENTKDARWCS